MIFIYNEKNYSINVKDIFDKAKPDDYLDMLDALGVVVHSLSNNPEFGNSTIMLFYNEITETITIEIYDKTNDDYHIIDVIEIMQDEKNIIKDRLQCE